METNFSGGGTQIPLDSMVMNPHYYITFLLSRRRSDNLLTSFSMAILQLLCSIAVLETVYAELTLDLYSNSAMHGELNPSPLPL